MSTMARRGFLKFLGAAPIAGPVVAQEAAAKMGLQPLLGGIGGIGGSLLSQTGETPRSIEYNHLEWLKERLKRLADPEYLAEMRRDLKWQVNRLDPDLAAMRGISPSAALSIQIDRIMQRNIKQETWNIRKQIKEATGF